MERTIHCRELCGSQRLQTKDGVQDEDIPREYVGEVGYIVREPEVDVAPTSNKDDATVAIAGVIHHDTDLELGEVPDLEGYRQREGIRDV